MTNNLNDDLILFNELIACFLEEERQRPVAECISPSDVHSVLDLKLRKEGMIDHEFKTSLKKLILKRFSQFIFKIRIISSHRHISRST